MAGHSCCLDESVRAQALERTVSLAWALVPSSATPSSATNQPCGLGLLHLYRHPKLCGPPPRAVRLISPGPSLLQQPAHLPGLSLVPLNGKQRALGPAPMAQLKVRPGLGSQRPAAQEQAPGLCSAAGPGCLSVTQTRHTHRRGCEAQEQSSPLSPLNNPHVATPAGKPGPVSDYQSRR